MPSTKWNFVTTTILTLVCAGLLFVTYRHAIRPILNRYNIPLQSLPSLLSHRSRGWMDARYEQLYADGSSDLVDDDSDLDQVTSRRSRENTDLPAREESRDSGRLSRDLEAGFRDDSDSDHDDTDNRLQPTFGNNLRELPPTPVDDRHAYRFSATRL